MLNGGIFENIVDQIIDVSRKVLGESEANPERHPHAQAANLPLLSTSALIVPVVYLALVFGLAWFMKVRKASRHSKTSNGASNGASNGTSNGTSKKHEEKDSLVPFPLIVVHNIILLFFSVIVAFETLHQSSILNYDWVGNVGNPDDLREIAMTKVLWVFYFSKIFEMVDTIIIILKGNFYQLSFLHVYHHCSIYIIWWFVMNYYPCGDSYFSASQNSIIHILMYSYYLLSLFKIPVPWKRYLTYLQMTQFVLNMVQAGYYLYVLKKEPALPMQILFYYCLTLLFLFGNYLIKSLQREKRSKTKKVE